MNSFSSCRHGREVSTHSSGFCFHSAPRHLRIGFRNDQLVPMPVPPILDAPLDGVLCECVRGQCDKERACGDERASVLRHVHLPGWPSWRPVVCLCVMAAVGDVVTGVFPAVFIPWVVCFLAAHICIHAACKHLKLVKTSLVFQGFLQDVHSFVWDPGGFFFWKNVSHRSVLPYLFRTAGVF